MPRYLDLDLGIGIHTWIAKMSDWGGWVNSTTIQCLHYLSFIGMCIHVFPFLLPMNHLFRT